MSRDDLIKTNANIVKEVTEKAIKYSPDAIIIVVSNPLDVMTYAAFLAANKDPHKVFGMAGILDTGRYQGLSGQMPWMYLPTDIHAMLLGGHGDTMVPLPRYTSVSGIPVTELLGKDVIDKIVDTDPKRGRRTGEPDGNLCLVCTGCSRVTDGRSHCGQSEKDIPGLCLSERGIRPERNSTWESR